MSRDKEQELAVAIEALQKREYRAPIQPMGCKDEREAVTLCYRANKGKAAGQIVVNCEQVVRDLDLCANLVRKAAMAKIVPGSLPKDES